MVKNCAFGARWLPLGKRMNFRESSFDPHLPTSFSENYIADFWGDIDVCAFWYNFTIKYIVNINGKLQKP